MIFFVCRCIPEFIVENIVCFLVFLRRFNPNLFEENGFEHLKVVLTFIVTYMGFPERMKNPHLRARLAEALETLLPYHKNDPPGLNTLGGYQREMLFKEYVYKKEVITFYKRSVDVTVHLLDRWRLMTFFNHGSASSSSFQT